jgi:hypothetical protein
LYSNSVEPRSTPDLRAIDRSVPVPSRLSSSSSKPVEFLPPLRLTAQQGREQEGKAQRVAGLQSQCNEPEEERRLVGVDVTVDARHQPVAGQHHVASYERESRLVRGPRVAQSDAAGDQQQAETE